MPRKIIKKSQSLILNLNDLTKLRKLVQRNIIPQHNKNAKRVNDIIVNQ